MDINQISIQSFDTKKRRKRPFGPHRKCAIDWCPTESSVYKADGFCKMHVARYHRGMDMQKRPDVTVKIHRGRVCKEEGCPEKSTVRGWCPYHYNQIQVHGKTSPRTKPGKNGSHSKPCGIDDCEILCGLGVDFCMRHMALMRRYGLDPRRMRQLFTDGGKCEICHAKSNLHVDHDHSCCPGGNGRKCGKCVRGLLCNGCNTALGLTEESPQRLRALASYAEKWAS